MPDRVGLRRVVYVGLVGVAAGLLWWGASLKADPVEPSLVDVAVESFQPPFDSPGTPRQTPISIDLAPGWTGILQVNGIEIPEDQLVRNAPLNQVTFTPGEGREIEQLPAGPVEVRAVIWRPLFGETREDGARVVTWRFRTA